MVPAKFMIDAKDLLLSTTPHLLPILQRSLTPIIPCTLPTQINKQTNNTNIMGLFWSKGVGGRHFGTSVHVDKNGVRRGPWRFSLGKFSCFRH
ncbi:hypothetical protein FPSE5266_20239 [Fusarium pseudograminearum]|nr:hypothetical protein FPSE5266_20239 [Fusarium pseudograminearum]